MNANANPNFWNWLSNLSNAANAELVNLVIANEEGVDIGDAAFAVLSNRHDIAHANALVAAEQKARQIEAWELQVEELQARIKAAA